MLKFVVIPSLYLKKAINLLKILNSKHVLFYTVSHFLQYFLLYFSHMQCCKLNNTAALLKKHIQLKPLVASFSITALLLKKTNSKTYLLLKTQYMMEQKGKGVHFICSMKLPKKKKKTSKNNAMPFNEEL